MGYVEETGVAQYYRDARIASIYEGTNAIQAIDLVGRKLLRDGGTTVSAFVSEMRRPGRAARECRARRCRRVRLWLAKGLDELVQCSTHLLTGERKDPELAGAAAFNYLMLVGTVIGGWQLARGALAAMRKLETRRRRDAAFLRTQVLLARFYAEHVMPRVARLRHRRAREQRHDHGADRRPVLTPTRSAAWPCRTRTGSRSTESSAGAAGAADAGWPSRAC